MRTSYLKRCPAAIATTLVVNNIGYNLDGGSYINNKGTVIIKDPP